MQVLLHEPLLCCWAIARPKLEFVIISNDTLLVGHWCHAVLHSPPQSDTDNDFAYRACNVLHSPP